MRICRLACTSVRIPFGTPFVTAHGTLVARESLILRLDTDDGATGWGEASAVPGFGGSHAEVEAVVRRLAHRILSRTLEEAEKAVRLPSQADSRSADPEPVAGRADLAARFGLDTTIQDLRGQSAGRPLAALLAAEPARAVAVNATVSAVQTAEAVTAARWARTAGFDCVKLKAGVAGSEEEESERIAAVRDAVGPGVTLRIDANGAWQPEQAIRIIGALYPLGLEYVEQPVVAGDLAGMARVRTSVRTPIAADEPAGGREDVRRVIEAGAADVIVLKPMLAGTLREALDIAALVREAGLGATVTSTLDSGVGVAAALHLAAALPASPVCGLATAALLAGDLLSESLPVERGAMPVPRRPGLGVRIDPVQLARYATRSWELMA